MAGLIGVEGNENADDLARKGAATPFVGPEPFGGLGDTLSRKNLKK